MSCPNGWSARIPGSARVQGDTMCTRFPIPHTPDAEECLTWQRKGGGLYEQHDASGPNTTLHVLSELKR